MKILQDQHRVNAWGTSERTFTVAHVHAIDFNKFLSYRYDEVVKDIYFLFKKTKNENINIW